MPGLFACEGRANAAPNTLTGASVEGVTSCSDGIMTLTDVSPGRYTVRGELLDANVTEARRVLLIAGFSRPVLADRFIHEFSDETTASGAHQFGPRRPTSQA